MGNRLRRLDDLDVSALLTRLGDGESPGVLKTVAWVLSLRPERIPVDRLLALGAQHPHDVVRRSALRTLGGVKDPRVRDLLRHAASRDEEPRNRREAISFLAFHSTDEQAVALAASAIGYEQDPSVRVRWINLAGVARTEAGRALAERVVRTASEDVEVRAMAATTITWVDRAAGERMASDATLPEGVRHAVGNQVAR
jgi:HEAT repeat protein